MSQRVAKILGQVHNEMIRPLPTVLSVLAEGLMEGEDHEKGRKIKLPHRLQTAL